jgi:hypothetical protein
MQDENFLFLNENKLKNFATTQQQQHKKERVEKVI